MLERIYVEIGNICNLSCSFCAGTKRHKKQMSVEEFKKVCQRIKGKTKYIYLHVLGEPLLHPSLDDFLKIARENMLAVCITTNGVLLSQKGDIISKNADIVHKVSISLHSLEGNDTAEYDNYLRNAVLFAKEMANEGIFVVFRLWNKDSLEGFGKNRQNSYIEDFLKSEYLKDWQNRPRGFRIAKNTFLEYDGIFTWPTKSTAPQTEKGFCYGISSQIAILVDGTVTPCCLDCEGEIPLGNIFEKPLVEILEGEKAKAIKNGFLQGKFTHPLCKKCTFARRFKVK